MDNQIQLLHQIIENQQLILNELKLINNSSQKLNSHIDFIENIYNTLRQPINYIMDSNLSSIKYK